MKKIIAFLMLFVVAFSMVGCADEKDSSSSQTSQTQKHKALSYAKDATNGSDLWFVKDGKTDYKIVLPQTATSEEVYGAEFLYDTVKDSTGVRLSTVTETASLDTNGYYIAVGKTSLLEKSGIVVDANELNTNGFVLALVGNTVVICGGSEMGTVYGCQEFLSYVISYEVYALQEVYYDKTSSVRMFDFETTAVAPSIAYISVGTRQAPTVEESIMFRGYSRLDLYDGGSGAIWDSQFIDHSVEKILPREDYPQWYTGSQICYSKAEAKDVIAEKMVERMKINPDSVFLYQLGNADDPTACSCKDCVQLSVTYGTAGGAYVVWMNDIAEKVEALMLQEGIVKEKWYVVGLMYNAFETAPVNYDEATDKYLPVNEDVVCNEHVAIQYAPIRACHAHAFDDDKCLSNIESGTKKDLYGWAELTDFLIIWTYNTEFYDFITLFDDYGAYSQNFKTFEKIGLDFYTPQRSGNLAGIFEALRTYVVAKLNWDASLDYKQLVDDFFVNYYKEAAPYMRELYEAMRAQTHKIGLGFGYEGCWVYAVSAGNYYAFANWPFQLLQSYTAIFKQAYEAIENADYTAKEKESLRLRIRQDEIFCDKYYVNNYETYFSASEYKTLYERFFDDCAILGYTEWAEGKYIQR